MRGRWIARLCRVARAGLVVAREYGIPAVVSVAGATEKIRTGQRIRVDGSRGFVEVLGD